ncbi:chemotaxis protein histidine kinase CheA [Bradyrhizobium japonicum]
MSSRALSLATVLLLIGFGATDTVLAQATNLEAGKAPSQLFAQTCSACHKSPRGLLKTVAPGSLPGFLRQHYTTSSDMAGVLASYLVSNGATDTRYQAKDGKDKRDGAAREKEVNTAPEHQGRRQRSQDAAKPDGEAAAVAPEGARQKRAARPPEEGSKEGARPEGQAAPEGRKARRRAKPGTEEAPKVDAAAPAIEDKKSEPKAETKPDMAKPDTAKVEPGRDEAKPQSKPAEKPAEARPDSAKVEPRGSDTPALRPDPVPQVTPAAPSAAAKPAEAKPAEEAAPKPVAPAASSEPATKPQEPAAPATAAAPPAAPADSSGAPTPPISR